MCGSGEAAAADAALAVPRRVGMRAPRLSRRGPARLLPLLWHAGRHERALSGEPPPPPVLSNRRFLVHVT